MKDPRNTQPTPESPEDLPPLIRTGTLARRWRVTNNCVRSWAEKGAIPAPIKMGPRALRWRRDEILAWEQGRERDHG